MTREIADKICAAFPGAHRSDPADGDLDAWKLHGKMFACFGGSDGAQNRGDGVSVKTPDVETAEMLIAAGRAVKAPYFHKSWVRIPWDLVDDEELVARLGASYDFIKSKLTKKARESLAPRNQDSA